MNDPHELLQELSDVYEALTVDFQNILKRLSELLYLNPNDSRCKESLIFVSRLFWFDNFRQPIIEWLIGALDSRIYDAVRIAVIVPKLERPLCFTPSNARGFADLFGLLSNPETTKFIVDCYCDLYEDESQIFAAIKEDIHGFNSFLSDYQKTLHPISCDMHQVRNLIRIALYGCMDTQHWNARDSVED